MAAVQQLSLQLVWRVAHSKIGGALECLHTYFSGCSEWVFCDQAELVDGKVTVIEAVLLIVLSLLLLCVF